jgi:hypothetical protein
MAVSFYVLSNSPFASHHITSYSLSYQWGHAIGRVVVKAQGYKPEGCRFVTQ